MQLKAEQHRDIKFRIHLCNPCTTVIKIMTRREFYGCSFLLMLVDHFTHPELYGAQQK